MPTKNAVRNVCEMDLKSVSEGKCVFKIPCRQRMLRLRDSDMELFLNELGSFDDAVASIVFVRDKSQCGSGASDVKGKRYFLQLLAVLKDKGDANGNTFLVIDGLKRMTMLQIVWNCLYGDDLFSLVDYRGNPTKYLSDFFESESDKDAITESYAKVKEFLKDKTSDFKAHLAKTIENAYFFWYDMDATPDEQLPRVPRI